MGKRITKPERERVLEMFADGRGRAEIAETLGLSKGQVAAIAAHVKMGTYAADDEKRKARREMREAVDAAPTHRGGADERLLNTRGVLLGDDVRSGAPVHWDPWPNGGTANPHMLIVGASGYGKSYAISCLVAELSRRAVPSAVFDYAQGFVPSTIDPVFVDTAPLVALDVTRRGIALNPLQIHSSDPFGPVNSAQRVADTFVRVYPRMGIQQHAVLRQAVLDIFTEAGIEAGAPETWSRPLPPFSRLYDRLQAIGSDFRHPKRTTAASVASHISTLFVFNTFRPQGEKLVWSEALGQRGEALLLTLNGLEFSVERAVTEFLLWSLIGHVEALGPGPLRCFVVLDEAHKLSFAEGSPVERLLREGRKFGVAVILSSQQPEDFSRVAFANTATKVAFQVADEQHSVSRKLYQKAFDLESALELSTIITRLPRGSAYVIRGNTSAVVRITSFKERAERWAVETGG